MATINGERLRTFRTARGFTMEDLAHKSGVTFGTVQRLETKGGDTKLQTLQALAKGFEVSVLELIVQIGDPQNDEEAKLFEILSKMSKLSPEHLERLAGYIDALIE